MPQVTVKLPRMGEGITDATIIRWLVKEGDSVIFDQPIVEIATDKVDSEVTAPAKGIIAKILAEEGSVPKVGEVIAIISDGESADLSALSSENIIEVSAKKPIAKNSDTILPKANTEGLFIPPYIRLAAQQLNITLQELEQLQIRNGSELLTKQQLLDYVNSRKHEKPIETAFSKPVNTEKKEKNIDVVPESPDYTIEEMSRMRKIISSRMKDSINTAPHVTSFIECDVTEMVQWFTQNRKTFEQRHGFKLTMSAFFIDAVAQTLREYPEVNASIKGEYILYKKPINIGFAVMLDNNELIVPVIKNANQLSLQGIGERLLELTTNSRNNALLPADIQGSTFTITNLGRFGTLTGTPIINQPDSAIMAFGAIIKKPAVVKVNDQLTIGIRDIIMLSHTYDHRIIDGGLGGRFLKSVCDYLSNFQGHKYL